MNKEDQKAIEELLYPILKAKVREQMDVNSPEFSVCSAIDESKPLQDQEHIYISDGQKYFAIPIKTPSLVNVSLLVDVLALKAFIQAV